MSPAPAVNKGLLYDGSRRVDVDPKFDNTDIRLGATARAPYGPENTWARPNGDREDYNKKTDGLTAMQKHVAYFDADNDGVIWPTDTFFGFYYLGFGIILSLLAMGIVHGPFSYPTKPTSGQRLLDWLPDPFMRIWVANIHRCKHGSDSESYDRRGQFQKHKFEEILEDYSSAHKKDALSFKDGVIMLMERRNLMDFFGIFAFMFEWGSTYMLLWPADGYMKKSDILGVIDGSIFPVIAERYKHGKGGGAFVAR